MPPLLALGILACALAGACGNPDNLVVGAILSSTTAVPDVTLTTVGSAIHGNATLLLPDGSSSPRAVVILADEPDLCSTLQSNPNFFMMPTTEIIALVMTVPQGMVGTFYPGTAASNATFLGTNGAGQEVAAFPSLSGTESVASFDPSPGGIAEGQFDIEFVDTDANPYEVYGTFKTTECDALAAAFIPQIFLEAE